MAQIVYVLTNKVMPGLVKIGRTIGTIEDRMRQLRSTGVPEPFECHFAAEVPDCERLEKILHRIFEDVRHKSDREFFRVDPAKVVLAISIGTFNDITPRAEITSQLAQIKVGGRPKSGRFSLGQVGVGVGDLLVLSRDESITCTVDSGDRVNFNGELMSLAKAGERALHSLGYTAPLPFQHYWKFEGELLSEKYARLSEQKSNLSPPSTSG